MKAKDVIKGLLLSHIFWAIVSFIMILVFTGITQDYATKGETIGLIISSIFFVLFGLGAVGISIFNLFIYLFKKLFKRKKK